MPGSKTKALAEAALLSALTIVMSLLGIYLPLIGSLVSLACPVPVAVLGLRQGIKWSSLSVLVTGIILALFLSPLQAASVVAGFGILGIALGELLHRQKSLSQILIWGTGASLLSKAVMVLIIIAFMGLGSITNELVEMQRMMEESLDLYQKMGMAPEQIELFRQSIKEMMRLMRLIFPTLFLLVSVMDTAINYYLCRYILKRLDHHLEPFWPVERWSMPKPYALILVVALLLLIGGRYYHIELIEAIGLNLQYLAMMIFVVQGLSVAVFYLKKWKVPGIMRTIIIILLFVNPFFTEILAWAGLLDIFFDYRRLRKVEDDGNV